MKADEGMRDRMRQGADFVGVWIGLISSVVLLGFLYFDYLFSLWPMEPLMISPEGTWAAVLIALCTTPIEFLGFHLIFGGEGLKGNLTSGESWAMLVLTVLAYIGDIATNWLGLFQKMGSQSELSTIFILAIGSSCLSLSSCCNTVWVFSGLMLRLSYFPKSVPSYGTSRTLWKIFGIPHPMRGRGRRDLDRRYKNDSGRRNLRNRRSLNRGNLRRSLQSLQPTGYQ